jgi:hypothetical protein
MSQEFPEFFVRLFGFICLCTMYMYLSLLASRKAFAYSKHQSLLSAYNGSRNGHIIQALMNNEQMLVL